MGKASVALVLVLLISGAALAESYVVCCRAVAMGGINYYGQQASCTKCSTPVVNNTPDRGSTICSQLGFFGQEFYSIEAAWQWRNGVHTCP
jgi:hypothetical protein